MSTEETQGGLITTNQTNAQGMIARQSENPAELREFYDSMKENQEDFEFQIHRLAMMQPQSPEITDGTAGYLQGQIIDNITREVISRFAQPQWLIDRGMDPKEMKEDSKVHQIAFMSIYKLPYEYIHWKPRGERQPGEEPYNFKTFDKADPRVKEMVWAKHGGKWGSKPEHKGKAPPVSINNNIVGAAVDLMTGEIIGGLPLIATYSRTSAGAGELHATQLRTMEAENLFPWGRIIYLYTGKEKNDKGSFQTYRITRGPLTTKIGNGILTEAIEFCKQLSAMCRNKDTGKQFQLSLLNAAKLVEDTEESEATPSQHDGNTVDSSGTSDPFAGESSVVTPTKGTPTKDSGPGF